MVFRLNLGLTNRFNFKNNANPNILSFADAPDDVIYIVFGVIIAMLIAGVTIILVAVTIR